MFFPEQTYQFTRPQDWASQHCASVWRSVGWSIPTFSSTVEAEMIEIPTDRAMFVTSYGVTWASAELTTSPASLRLSAVKTGFRQALAGLIPGVVPTTLSATGILKAMGEPVNILVPGGYRLSVRVDLSSVAGADWTGNAFVTGVMIPRGNITEQ